MDFRGIYENGVVRPTEPVALPSGTQVECRPVTPGGSSQAGSFWSSPSLEALAAEQGTPRSSSPEELRGDWPRDESIDEFLAELRRWRR